MIILGLTGSIGMGKSTVSEMFLNSGVPVWDADAQVHEGYTGGSADEDAIYQYLRVRYPEACTQARIDRKILGEIVFNDREKLRDLERIFGHYLELKVGTFIADYRWAGEPPALIVLDVPLLMESKWMGRLCDYVAVVHCSDEEQKARCLRRPGMTEERLASILRNQMPSAEKVKSADIRIDTSRPMMEVRERVSDIIANIADEKWAASQMYDENGLLL